MIKFINFVEECCENNSSFVADGGSFSSFVQPFGPHNSENKEIFMIRKRNGSRVYRTKTIVWHNLTRNLVDLFLSDGRNKYRFETTPSGDRVLKKLQMGKMLCYRLILDKKLLVGNRRRENSMKILLILYLT